MRLLKIEYKRTDARGSLIQVNTAVWRQFNYLKIKKGESFGGHYHKHKTELFYLIRGKMEVVTNETKDERISVALKPGEGVIIFPYDWHALYAETDTEIVELLSKPYSKEDVYNV